LSDFGRILIAALTALIVVYALRPWAIGFGLGLETFWDVWALRLMTYWVASKVDEDQLFYCRQRGIGEEEAVALVVNGFCREVLQQLPMEFAVEAQKLVGISLEGSVG
jgi:hypothetical protein